MRTIYLAAALAGMAIAPALAQSPARSSVSQAGTVADLATLCDPPADSSRRLEAISYCQGYLTAAGQLHAALHPAGGARPPLYCLPTPPPTVAETGLAFAAWARQNPEHDSEPAIDGLFRWMQATYPCPASATPQRPARSRTTR